MNRPAHPGIYADRMLDCEFALQDLFGEMMDEALRAGWRPSETCVAISSLADHFMLKIESNGNVAQKIAEAFKARNFSPPDTNPPNEKD